MTTDRPHDDDTWWAQSTWVGLRAQSDAAPAPGRVYDAWLGGKDNYAEDRALAEEIDEMAPGAFAAAHASRWYLERSVSRLAGLGIDQFLDLGCGIAQSRNNVHQIARGVLPAARVVYVDNEPVTVAIARAALEQAGGPGVAVLEADIRQPREILDWIRDREVLDLQRPVAVLFASVLHFVPDGDRPGEIVRAFRDALVPGSYLLISHVGAEDDESGALTRAAAKVYGGRIKGTISVRTAAEVATLFAGLEPFDPVSYLEWKGRRVAVLAGIGRVPEDYPERRPAAT